jgi:hypothetical protein
MGLEGYVLSGFGGDQGAEVGQAPGEALGFFRECVQLHLREDLSNSDNPHPPLFLSELNFRLCPDLSRGPRRSRPHSLRVP